MSIRLAPRAAGRDRRIGSRVRRHRPERLVEGTATHDLVSVSSGYGQPCVAFAGDELRGTPVTNHVALWQERLWTWGVPLLGLTLLVLALWAYSRRQRTWRKPLRDLPPIITQPF